MSGVRQFEQFCRRSKSKHVKSSLIMLKRFFATVEKPNKRRSRTNTFVIPRESYPEVRSMYRAGYPQSEIAAHFGVNHGRVNDIIKGKKK